MRGTGTSQDGASWMCRDGFCCILDEQPTHLVPQRLLRQAQTNLGTDELSFNPDCRICSGNTSDGLDRGAGLLTTSAPTGGNIAWIRDPATGTDTPFWLGPRLSQHLQAIEHDAAAIPDLPPEVRALLCGAQILVPPDYAYWRRQTWSAVIQQCGAKFRQNGHAPVAGLIREAVKPSYVYLAAYQAGARLEKHTDREQCEFSISLCLDYSPEPACATPWPLHLDTARSTVTVYQALGDGLLYRGRELPHYRGTLAEGNSSTSIFFHYVPEAFSGSLA